MTTRYYLRYLAWSALLHILLLLLAFQFFLNVRHVPVPRTDSITLVFQPPPPAPALPQAEPQPKTRRFVTADNMIKADAPDPQALFESDANTRASSRQRTEGDASIGGQQGMKDIPMSLRDTPFSPQTPAQTTAASPPQPTAPPAPTKPPTKLEENPFTLSNQGLGVATPAPTLPPSPPVPQTATAPSTTGKQPALVPPSQFSPQQTRSEIRGGAIEGMDTSIASQESEFGRYKAKLYRAIGSRWYLYVQRQISVLNVGNVRMRFYVRADGVIEKIEVLRGDSRSVLAGISRRAIADIGKLEPFSEALRQQLGEGYYEEITFSIY